MCQFDPCVPFIAGLSLRDQRETMEIPFFSLAKSKRLTPIKYSRSNGEIWVQVLPHPNFGMATIWDADILIWVASVLMAAKNRKLTLMPRTLHFQPYDLLRTICRKTGGADYRLLREALARLQATVVKTNPRPRAS